jgi:hypothetical protein
VADIYTPDWYAEVRSAINEAVADLTGLPEGDWMVKVEIVGDGVSPYVAEGDERHFLIRSEEGRCDWYREVDGDEESVRLNYRFRGPATTFDGIAASLVDPIDAALSGAIKVKGDMRLLMRHARHVAVLLEAYAHGVDTAWPEGRPPYESGD